MIKAVLFDWDGTLWDTLGFMVETYGEVYEHLGMKPWTAEDFRERFRHDWREMLGDMGLKQHEQYINRYWEEKIKRTRPPIFPWVRPFVSSLSSTHYLGVVSSAPKKPLLRELKRNKILNSMRMVVANEDAIHVKPSPAPLLIAAKHLGVRASECVYVGDMVDDVRASHKAGMKCIAVGWGLHSNKRLMAENPAFLAENPDMMRDFIKGLL